MSTRLPPLAGPAPAAPLTAAPSRRPRRRSAGRGRGLARRPSGHAAALALVLGVSLVLRLWGVRQGLPYSYNVDEATHFVPRAVSFFGQDLNPHYFLNPPAYSYLLGIVFELWFGSADAVARVYASDPSSLFVAGAGRRGAARHRRGVAHLPRRPAAVGARRGAAGRRHPRRGVPAGLLQPPGAERRADARPGGALALGHCRGRAGRPLAGLPHRRSRHRAGRGDEVHGRHHRRLPARRVRGGGRVAGVPARAPRASPARSRSALAAVRGGRSVRGARLARVHRRDLLAGGTGRRAGSGQARDRSRQRRGLLPVELHLGHRVGSEPRRARRCGAAARAPAVGAGARAAAGPDRCSSSSWAASSGSSAAG